MATYRDVEPPAPPAAELAPAGRCVVAVVGIDRYRNWGRLKNAVNDALGVRDLFRELGFAEPIPPLIDDAATFAAMRRLVITDLRKELREHDSLVLFFAGHGYTETSKLQSTPVRVGYVIPADGDSAGGDAGTWLELESWLKEVTRLPARHILVILDSCHSGMALELSRVRGASSEPLQELLSRRSRRVITSALDNQQALDDGPVPDHSLFTGLLVRALRGDIAGSERLTVTGAELAVHLQRHVSEYRGQTQTPDFGTLPWDAGGDMAIPVLNRTRVVPAPPPSEPRNTTPASGSATPASGAATYRWYRRVGVAVAVAAALAVGAMLRRPAADHGPGAEHGSGSSQSADIQGDANLHINASIDGDAGSVPEPVSIVDGNDITLASDSAIADGDSMRDSGAARPVKYDQFGHCHRADTGGYAIGKPTCASSVHCSPADVALRDNPSFKALQCKELCTCR